MGAFDMNIPDDLLGLESLLEGDLGKEMVDAALPVLQESVKAGYAAHNRTGQLESSVKVYGARQAGDGYFGYVAPSGTRSDGKRNGEIAVYLEYGTGRQPSTPVVGPAVAKAESKVLQKMQEVFDSKAGAS